MKSLNGCSSFSSQYLSALLLIIFLLPCLGSSQSLSSSLTFDSGNSYQYQTLLPADTLNSENNVLPNPKDVMFKSLLIPGWGQITNRQAWKVPIVYGLLGGLGWYSIFLNKKYHDYRAAFYNLNEQTPDDFKFGQTPAYLSSVNSLESLRTNRNFFRNRRDFIYITVGLAYGLNVIDAYVFAHMRSFDVSENLSVRTSVEPSILAKGSPGFTLSLQLFKQIGAK